MCLGAAAGIPPPERGSIGGLSAAVLSSKNADAKRRLCAEAKRGGRVGVALRATILTPTRFPLLRMAKQRKSTSPFQGEVSEPAAPLCHICDHSAHYAASARAPFAGAVIAPDVLISAISASL